MRTSAQIDEALSFPGDLGPVLGRAGEDERLRTEMLEALRPAEARADDPTAFRRDVRWPLTLALLSKVGSHRVRLANGLVFEVGADSRIEKALLLSPDAHPDHVWEPQTTKLLQALAEEGRPALVGGAYIGDHALFLAHALAPRNAQVHAFEPMGSALRRLVTNAELSEIENLTVHRLALWDESGVQLGLKGPPALAAASPERSSTDRSERVESITIDDYIQSTGLAELGILMLDTEGGEERALVGAGELLTRPVPAAPHCIFEIHREYVDWSAGLERTEIVRLLADRGYVSFAIRDVHGTVSMRNQPIEVIPVDHVWLGGTAARVQSSRDQGCWPPRPARAARRDRREPQAAARPRPRTPPSDAGLLTRSQHRWPRSPFSAGQASSGPRWSGASRPSALITMYRVETKTSAAAISAL